MISSKNTVLRIVAGKVDEPFFVRIISGILRLRNPAKVFGNSAHPMPKGGASWNKTHLLSLCWI